MMRGMMALAVSGVVAAQLAMVASAGAAHARGPAGALIAADSPCDNAPGGDQPGCDILAAPAGALSAAGYGPADLRSAYGLQSASAGMRQTVAVVAAFDDPRAEADLGVYRSAFGLPACTTANRCFREVNQAGHATPLPGADASWAVAAAADLDMVSAICPNCHLLLVEAASTAITDMGAAVNTAVTLGASFVDVGWSVPEVPADTTYDTQFFNHPGVAVVAPSAQASNGAGYGLIGYPAAAPHVTAVGGTTLRNTGAGERGWSETAWPASGSGCSLYEPKPARQQDTGCGDRRTVNDVAADANPTLGDGAVASYDSYSDGTYQAPGWAATGGTSIAAGIVTGVYALAGTPEPGTYPLDYPYQHPGGLNGITGGSTGTCSPTYLCTAGNGYDAPTGQGSPAFTDGFANSGQHTGAIYSGVPGKCVDDNKRDTGNGNPVDVFTCNGEPNQSWTLMANGTIQVYGKCLDVAHAGTANGTKVDLYDCDGGDAQRWRVRSSGQLYNPGSGRCLDDPGASGANNTQLDILDCQDSATPTGPVAVAGERWTVPYPQPPSTGPVVSGVDANLCLDDLKTSVTDGNPVDIFTCNGSTAQSWTLTARGELRVLGSCLDVAQSGTADGASIDLWTCNGTGAQQWRPQADGLLLNPQSGKCLDDPQATTVIRTQLQLATCTPASAQQWFPQ